MVGDIADFATQIICAPIDLSSGGVVDAVRRCGGGDGGGRGRSSQLRQHDLYIATRQHTLCFDRTTAGGRQRRQFPLSTARQSAGKYQSLTKTTVVVEMNSTGCRPTPPSGDRYCTDGSHKNILMDVICTYTRSYLLSAKREWSFMTGLTFVRR